MKYRRLLIPGGTYFFTLVTHQRKRIFHIPQHVDLLRESRRQVQTRHPFTIVAAVILPDHLHMIWTLPENDADYSMRWRLIKAGFTIEYQQITGDTQPWQNRYWEHFLHDDQDLERHMEYIHYNPVKHGWVEKPEDWKYSSIHKLMRDGAYPEILDSNEIRGMIAAGDG
ncbi:REP-associated tyrosine transposase [Longilinea arvoryzae]|nr:transposase [Longilinea arvoryzae]